MRRELGLLFLFTLFVVMPVAHAETPAPTASQARVENRFVCMMNNKVFGKDQIPVEVGGKTYYGCCEGCKTSLKINPAMRVARDPFTGKEVDKANAYIVTKPNGSDEVLYFESLETYESFLNQHIQ